MASITWKGTAQVRAQLQSIAEAVPGGIAQALREFGEAVLTDAKTTYVPVDTGALRASGFVEGLDAEGTVLLGFGGPAAPYAVIVHEDLTVTHKVGQAKYLETPLKLRLGLLAQVLRDRANQAVRRGIQRLGKVERLLARRAARASG